MEGHQEGLTNRCRGRVFSSCPCPAPAPAPAPLAIVQCDSAFPVAPDSAAYTLHVQRDMRNKQTCQQLILQMSQSSRACWLHMQTLEPAWFTILTQPLSKLCSNLLCLGFFTSKMEIIIVSPYRDVVRIKSIHVKPLQYASTK